MNRELMNLALEALERRIPVLDLMPHITVAMTTLQIANRAGYSRGYVLRALNGMEAA